MHPSDQPAVPITKRWADALFSVLTALMALCVASILVLVFINVVMRYVFNSGIDISTEVARLSFVWLTFIGTVLAFRSRTHLAVNMFLDRVPLHLQKPLHIIRQLIILWLLWLCVTGGWEQTVIGMRTVTPVAGMPISVFSGAVLFAAIGMAALTILDLITVLRTPVTPENVQVFRTSVDTVEEI